MFSSTRLQVPVTVRLARLVLWTMGLGATVVGLWLTAGVLFAPVAAAGPPRHHYTGLACGTLTTKGGDNDQRPVWVPRSEERHGSHHDDDEPMQRSGRDESEDDEKPDSDAFDREARSHHGPGETSEESDEAGDDDAGVDRNSRRGRVESKEPPRESRPVPLPRPIRDDPVSDSADRSPASRAGEDQSGNVDNEHGDARRRAPRGAEIRDRVHETVRERVADPLAGAPAVAAVLGDVDVDRWVTDALDSAGASDAAPIVGDLDAAISRAGGAPNRVPDAAPAKNVPPVMRERAGPLPDLGRPAGSGVRWPDTQRPDPQTAGHPTAGRGACAAGGVVAGSVAAADPADRRYHRDAGAAVDDQPAARHPFDGGDFVRHGVEITVEVRRPDPGMLGTSEPGILLTGLPALTARDRRSATSCGTNCDAASCPSPSPSAPGRHRPVPPMSPTTAAAPATSAARSPAEADDPRPGRRSRAHPVVCWWSRLRDSPATFVDGGGTGCLASFQVSVSGARTLVGARLLSIRNGADRMSDETRT